MKKNEVRIGGQYLAKITNKVVAVRIDGEHVHGGWNATNLATNKKVRIKSAQALRSEAPADSANAATVAPAPAEATTDTPEAPVAAQAATKRGTRANAASDGAAKPLGIVGAAVRILEDHDNQTPLNCSEMVAEMQEKGYWQPRKGGKTPSNTLYSALLREINTKAEASRFRKTERGRFLLTASR